MRDGKGPQTWDQPNIYLIRVRGHLDGVWSDRLAGMQITVDDRNTETHTELVGRLIDQSALMGVLTALYDLGMPILTVSTLPEPNRAQPA